MPSLVKLILSYCFCTKHFDYIFLFTLFIVVLRRLVKVLSKNLQKTKNLKRESFLNLIFCHLIFNLMLSYWLKLIHILLTVQGWTYVQMRHLLTSQGKYEVYKKMTRHKFMRYTDEFIIRLHTILRQSVKPTFKLEEE